MDRKSAMRFCLSAAMALASAGCACGAVRSAPPSTTQPALGASLEERRQAAQMKLEAARQALQAAQGDLRTLETSRPLKIQKAKAEKSLADLRLAQFKEIERDQKIKKAEQELRSGRDRLEDLKEELEQLKKMYKEDELADQTKEVVVKRTERAVERTTQALETQERGFRLLQDFELPAQLQQLELEAASKAVAQELAEHQAELEIVRKRTEILRARMELAKAEQEFKAVPEPKKEPKPTP